MLGGDEFAARVIRSRAGATFDPAIAEAYGRRSNDIFAGDDGIGVVADTG